MFFNPRGAYAVYRKEVLRFLKVYNQTLLAPVVTAMLFLAVFTLAIGKRAAAPGDVSFGLFMMSGLIIMTAMQNAFANSSSSFTMSKVLGTIIDYLMPPLSPGEIIAGMTLAGVTRGVSAGFLVAVAGACVLDDIRITYPLLALGYLALASLLMALCGLITGMVSETFDQTASITAYVITPLAFLSGTFYPVANLPPFWQEVSRHNPFFHMIDGFRYSVTGNAEGDLAYGMTVLCALIALLFITAYVMLSKGYRVKS